jgi:hypothetical protein
MDGGILCLLLVVGLVALLVYLSKQKANNRFRNHCGECSYVSQWMTESSAEQDAIRHYATNHPQIRPGGHMESRMRR